MTNDAYREQWLKWRKKYDRTAFALFKKAIKQSFAGIPIDSLTYENYKILIPLNVQIEPIQRAYRLTYSSIGLMHGRRVGFGINRELKRFDNDFFSKSFQESILDWVRENCGSRIISVSETIAKRISRLIEVSQEQGLSVVEMRKYLFEKINLPGFTKWQALRIARTEVTTAANHAAEEAGENAGIMLEKFWISGKSERTRRIPRDNWDHLHMDGVSVGQFEKFTLRSKGGTVDNLNYPGAPGGSAGDVINCECTIAYRPMRDANGFVISR
jgi:hypothetical protein